METRVLFSQLGPSLSFTPQQLGLKFWKVWDSICWRSNMEGDYFGSFSASPQASPAALVSMLKDSQRRESEQHRSYCRGAKIHTLEEESTVTYRLSRRRSREESRKRKVRSFVDEATVHPSDLDSTSPASASERSIEDVGERDLCSAQLRVPETGAEYDDPVLDQSSSREDQLQDGDGEYGMGAEAENLPSVDIEYNYEDMKLGEQKNWSIADMTRLDLLRNFEYRHSSEKGVFVVQSMRVEDMKATEELLVDSFAELMGGLLTYRPLLALTVQQYVRDRYACLPDAVTLVGLYAPAEDNVVIGRTENGNWVLSGTVELSFSDAGHPDIPAGPAPPQGSPYLCNMAVSDTYRRRGLGRQLLKAAEELAVLMGAQDLYLHCRMIDMAPLNMYQGAGYQIVATDSILSLLSFHRRRYLMRKRLPAFTNYS